mgnify:CR=1 FL=1
MNQYNKMTTEELRSKAISLVIAMTEEQAAEALRILEDLKVIDFPKGQS